MTPPPAAEIRRYKYATAVEMMRNGATMTREAWFNGPFKRPPITFGEIVNATLEDTLAGDWIEI